jgi:hypothetical protein
MADQIIYIPRPIGFGTTESPALIDSALTTLERAKVFLRREENDDEDYKISLCVNHASGFIERWCRRKLKSSTATYYVDGAGERSVALPEWPMTSITSASSISGDVDEGSEIDVSGVLPHEGGVVTLREEVFPVGNRNICIVAECGYKTGVHDSDLAALELACLILSQVYFVKMNNQAYGATAVGLAGAVSTVDIANENAPPEVVDIMKNYQRIC